MLANLERRGEMTSDTIDLPRRTRQVQKITGALAAIPTSSPTTSPLLRDPDLLTDRAFLELSESKKLAIFQAMREQMIHQQQRYVSLLKISSALGASVQEEEFLPMTMDFITDVMRAERSSLFIVDDKSGTLRGVIAQGSDQEILLPPGQGIAGWVARTGRSLNIQDAYDDPRFYSGTDSETGFETRSILCQPLRNGDGETVAILQVLNSLEGAFSEDDENLLSAIGAQIAIALENGALYRSLIDKNRQLRSTATRLEHKIAELDLLYDIQSRIGQQGDLESLVEVITRKTLELINGEACAVTLKEGEYHRVHIMIDRSPTYSREWDFYTVVSPAEDTIASTVIHTGEPFICHDGACRHLPGPDSPDGGLTVDNLIAVPLFDDDECIGALQVFNLAMPHDPNQLGFTDDDVKVLTLIASQIASTVAARRRRDEQEKEDRLATIGQMIAGILHDFKTPFAVISGYVQLMADTDDSALRKDYAHRVVKQFQELNQMTRELLRFARGDSQIFFRKVLVGTFMQEVGELLKTEFAERNIELDLQVAYRGKAQMDPVKMKRALLNLARNASDAMPDGGQVSLRVEEAQGRLRFVFEDSGAGIPLEIRSQLFESFVTRDKEGGTGLGLAVVKKIVDDHKGTISFSSDLGAGTTFVIELPIQHDDQDKA